MPNGRGSAAMKHSEDNDAMFFFTKINTVRETVCNDAPNVLTNNGKLERVFRCQRHIAVNFSNELKSKTNSLASMNSALAAR